MRPTSTRNAHLLGAAVVCVLAVLTAWSASGQPQPGTGRFTTLAVTSTSTYGDGLVVTSGASGTPGLQVIAQPTNANGIFIRGRASDDVGRLDFTSNNAGAGQLFFQSNASNGTFGHGSVNLGTIANSSRQIVLDRSGDSGIQISGNAKAFGITATNTDVFLIQDDSDGDPQISMTGTTLSFAATGGFAFVNGRINSNTSQPGFLAFNSVSDNGGPNLTVDFDTEVFDNASNFAADVFTAPVTGQYVFCVSVTETPGQPASPDQVTLVTSNRGFLYTYPQMATSIAVTLSACVHGVDMDVADTASVLFQDTNGGSSDSIAGSGSPYRTYFSGRLVP